MAFGFLTNTAPETAREEYISWLRARGFEAKPERVAAVEASGRTSACGVYANCCAPHYAACAMDGIAIAASASFGCSETRPAVLGAGSFTVADTGDPLPEGCDAVVMVEELLWGPDGSVRLTSPVTPGQNVRQTGEDVCAGELLLGSYTRISPSAVGALLAGGVTELDVLRRPVVGIIPTGDELVRPCAAPKPGEVMEFNSAIFSSMLREWGAEPRVWPIVRDEPEKIRTALAEAAEGCDIVLLGAGSSAGRDDCSAAVLEDLGEVLYHGLAMKPGKPAILGAVRAVPVVGVPGYPVSGILVLEEIVKPLLDEWYRRAPEPAASCRAVLTRPVVSGLKYKEYLRVRMGSVGGRIVATPLSRGSGVVSSFMRADGILEVPQGTEGYEAGSEVEVRLLSPMEKLRNTLVVVGSHDPLLDELADLLHIEDRRLWMSSSHVGSMGGLMAVRRGEAHMAGCHLLDTETGEYNVSYIRRYFPNGGVHLIRCVGRVQGLMAAPGNPLGLKGIEDLARPGLRYVNRQRGSGTRVLADWLCARAGVDTGRVYGYAWEEPTHTAAAAQVANGRADAALGIWSAAKLYDLSFIPICEERYDLLVPDSACDSMPVQAALKLLRSEAFKARLAKLGGYTLDRPGEEIEI